MDIIPLFHFALAALSLPSLTSYEVRRCILYTKHKMAPLNFFFKITFHLTFDLHKVILTEAFSHAAWSSLWAFYQISSETHWPLKSVDIQGNPCMLTKVKGGWILGHNDVLY